MNLAISKLLFLRILRPNSKDNVTLPRTYAFLRTLLCRFLEKWRSRNRCRRRNRPAGSQHYFMRATQNCTLEPLHLKSSLPKCEQQTNHGTQPALRKINIKKIAMMTFWHASGCIPCEKSRWTRRNRNLSKCQSKICQITRKSFSNKQKFIIK